MKIAIYQYGVLWMKPEENLGLIEEVAMKVSGNCDLLILPEMFNTGYTMTPKDIPIECQEKTISKLKDIATKYNLVIGGSIPYQKHSLWYNTMIFVSSEGLIFSYDKVHLFTSAGEKEVYSAGTEIKSFSLYNLNILPLICYDLRFSYLANTQATYDIIIYSANWPEARIEHWRSLLKARAIENQCYVIGVNRTGSDPNGYIYPGSSMVVNYNGDILECLDDNPGYAVVEVIKELLENYRKKLPFLHDRKSNFLR